MMRKIAFLTAFTAASAQATDKTGCALNGARAVDDMLDSATYIWASVQRCQKPTAANKGNTILCSMDVSAAIEAVNSMVNVVLKGVRECGELEGEHTQCGLSVGVLTKAFAGVAASSAGIVAKCPNKLNGGQALTFLVQGPTINQGNSAQAAAANTVNGAIGRQSFARCLVDVGDVTTSLFKATKRIIDVKHTCNADQGFDCTRNSLKVVAGFAAMGEYLAGAIGRCSTFPNTPAGKAAEEKRLTETGCADKSLELIRDLDDLSKAGIEMSKHCEEGAQRLYELEKEDREGATKNNSFVTFALAALLPTAAVFGFVGGSRFGKTQRNSETFDEAETAMVAH